MVPISAKEAAVSDTDPRAENWAETGDEDAEDAWAGAEPGLETSEADAIEQRETVGSSPHDLPGSVPDEADEADATEQRRDLGLDDEDYR